MREGGSGGRESLSRICLIFFCCCCCVVMLCCDVVLRCRFVVPQLYCAMGV